MSEVYTGIVSQFLTNYPQYGKNFTNSNSNFGKIRIRVFIQQPSWCKQEGVVSIVADCGDPWDDGYEWVFYANNLVPKYFETQNDLDEVLDPIFQPPNAFAETYQSTETDVPKSFTFPYDDNNPNSSLLLNIPVGSYVVGARDKSKEKSTPTNSTNFGQIELVSFTVSQLPPLIVEFDVISDDDQNGIYVNSINGGDPPYYYIWSLVDGDTPLSGIIEGYDKNYINDYENNVSYGKYKLIIRDSQDCEKVFYFDIIPQNCVPTNDPSIIIYKP